MWNHFQECKLQAVFPQPRQLKLKTPQTMHQARGGQVCQISCTMYSRFYGTVVTLSFEEKVD